MNKQEFVEKLKMHGAWCTECHDIHGEKDRYVKVAKVRELLEQLDKPQVEKVEVPDFVAEWYEENEGDINQAMYNATIDVYSNRHTTEFEKWFSDSRNDTYGTIVRMKDGYTVKQEPKWIVKTSEGYWVNSITSNLHNSKVIDFSDNKRPSLIFLDKKTAEAVATLIDGSVEEV